MRPKFSLKLLTPASLAIIAIPLMGFTGASGPAGEVAGGMPWWVEFIEKMFILLTAATVAFGILHVEIELLHWVWITVRKRMKHVLGEPHPGKVVQSGGANAAIPVKGVKRFDGHQRIQHVLLMSSFIVLALTGITEKFYKSTPFGGIIDALGGFNNIRLIHRVAAGVMVFDGFYHLLYLTPGVLTLKKGMPQVKIGTWLEMVPSPKDVRDFTHAVSYLMGMRHDEPKFGKFTYIQKFDYWAVFWGLTVMAISGAFMLFPAISGHLAGTAGIAAALAAHSDEAILAMSWILIVHMYNVHLGPRVFPFNPTIFTGRISAKLLASEHQLQYEHFLVEQVAQAPTASSREYTSVATKAPEQARR